MQKVQRNSNIELFRIIMMISIVAHHLVVNSGIVECFDYQNITGNMIFLQLFGFAGKAMINGFLLITGYFMVKSKFSLNRVVKLYIQIKLYKFLIYIILAMFGYQDMSLKALIVTVFSVAYSMGVSFTGTFFVLSVLSPFINKLILAISKTQFTILLSIMLFYFTILSTFLFNDTFDEIAWYCVVYLIGAYIRLYPIKFLENKKCSGVLSLIVLILCYLSIISIDILNNVFNVQFSPYHFVINAHKILALILAVLLFCFFKNLKIKNNKFINAVSSATFGVFLIHSSSESMRNLIWKHIFNIKGHYFDEYLFVYAFVCVFLIYVACVLTDLMRIKFVEKPLFNKLSKHEGYKNLCSKIDEKMNF